MSRPIIALLTDFGTVDHYVGAMKGVMLGICPEATLVDLTHDVPAHDIRAGARQLAACYRYFPAGTIFVAVVDPGVGSGRRGLAADAGDFRFVAPDNGVLSGVFDETSPKHLVELTERKFARATISKTFEGRDRFAPAAAWLARGTALTAMGRPLSSCVRLPADLPRDDADRVVGTVAAVDRFGNLVTNIHRRHLARLLAEGRIEITLDGRAVSRLIETYADATPGEVCALFGSTEHLEVVVRGASAAAVLAAAAGADITVRRV